MVNDKNFGKALQLVENSRSVLITTHTKPDGDAGG
jgi:nanoRNase/pAp phosphatase (c-di-AMP/oligoRNAs hydrolase)